LEEEVEEEAWEDEEVDILVSRSLRKRKRKIVTQVGKADAMGQVCFLAVVSLSRCSLSVVSAELEVRLCEILYTSVHFAMLLPGNFCFESTFFILIDE
jgi:hypothetical protein